MCPFTDEAVARTSGYSADKSVVSTRLPLKSRILLRLSELYERFIGDINANEYGKSVEQSVRNQNTEREEFNKNLKKLRSEGLFPDLSEAESFCLNCFQMNPDEFKFNTIEEIKDYDSGKCRPILVCATCGFDEQVEPKPTEMPMLEASEILTRNGFVKEAKGIYRHTILGH